MNTIKMVSSAVLFGMGYQAFATVLGSKVAGVIWRDNSINSAEWRRLTSLLLGVLAHAFLAAMVLLVAPSGAKSLRWLFWILFIFILVDWRRTRVFVCDAWRNIAVVAAYGSLCYTVMMCFHFGAARGDNLLWSVYRLTSITPGDSPQGLLQAQYLLYGHTLSDFKNFSMFDRPFLGGIISAAALAIVHRTPDRTFNIFTDAQDYAYFALWIWLNSSFTYVVATLAKRYATANTRFTLCAVVLASPCIVFNTIGAWPKLFAVYIAFCAALLAISGYWRMAVTLSGISFLTHGSFLWSHLSMSGVLIIYVLLTPKEISGRIRQAAVLAAIALAYPVIWFASEHFSGAATPLTTYYLYSVPTDFGFSHSLSDAAQGFYAASNPANLAALPFVNLLKSLLPYEIMQWIDAFSYAGGASSWRAFANNLFFTQVTRPFFAFCLTAGVVTFTSLRREIPRNWHLSLALIAFFLLPLIPGMGLYRRDDHFITDIMMFSLLPVVMALAFGFNQFSRTTLRIVASLIFAEFALVYWQRYPSIRYEDTFYEYYLWTTLPFLAIAYLAVLCSLSFSGEKSKHDAHWQDKVDHG